MYLRNDIIGVIFLVGNYMRGVRLLCKRERVGMNNARPIMLEQWN